MREILSVNSILAIFFSLSAWAIPPSNIVPKLPSGDGIVKMTGGSVGFSATTDDLSEGSTNKYYTDQRVSDEMSSMSTSNLTEGANLYWTNSRFDTRFSSKTTSDVTEGSNLYYTSSRFDSAFAAKSTTNLAEGSNQYFTNSRAISAPITGFTAGAGTVSSSDTILQALQKIVGNINAFVAGVSSVFGRSGAVTAQSGDYNTSQVTENTNLYYTDSRARAAISASSPLTYSSGSVGCQTASGSQSGCLSSSNWSTFNSKLSSVSYTASTPTRALNTNFTPSSTSAVMACYTVKISCSLTITGSCTGTVELRSDTNSTPTTSRARAVNEISATLALTITIANNPEHEMCYLVPPNHNVRLVSSGTATISITAQSETLIAVN